MSAVPYWHKEPAADQDAARLLYIKNLKQSDADRAFYVELNARAAVIDDAFISSGLAWGKYTDKSTYRHLTRGTPMDDPWDDDQPRPVQDTPQYLPSEENDYKHLLKASMERMRNRRKVKMFYSSEVGSYTWACTTTGPPTINVKSHYMNEPDPLYVEEPASKGRSAQARSAPITAQEAAILGTTEPPEIPSYRFGPVVPDPQLHGFYAERARLAGALITFEQISEAGLFGNGGRLLTERFD